jgi:hypothetical protein
LREEPGLLSKDEARRIAHDDNGGRKDKRPNIGVRPFGGIKIAMI